MVDSLVREIRTAHGGLKDALVPVGPWEGHAGKKRRFVIVLLLNSLTFPLQRMKSMADSRVALQYPPLSFASVFQTPMKLLISTILLTSMKMWTRMKCL